MKRKKIYYCLLISILFLLIGTKSSPVYQINDWYDANCFLTVGKSMIKGLVPYLDLFEQKGPLLYLIYGIASLISSTNYIGVFIIEVVSYTIFLYYIDKIIALLTKEKYSYILLPILSLLILSSRSFTHGGSCEEFTFPILAITVYYFIKYLQTNKITNQETLIIGIMAGLIFWMKYTLLGFHIGFCFIVFLKKIKEKQMKDLFYKIGYFILGFTITSIPWIIYFGMHKNGVKKLIDIYFLFNITSYAEDISISQKIINCFSIIKGVLLKYYQYLILIFFPILLSIKTKTFFKERENNICLLIPILTLLICIFLGGTNFRYYSLPMQLFMIFGLIFIIKFIEKSNISNLIQQYIVQLSIITITICLPIAYYRSPNTEYLKYKREDYAQFVFADKIDKNKTILNYGFLDGGFYLTTNTYPTVYYFQKNNINYNLYQDNVDEQRKYITEKLVDYIITNNKIKEQDIKLIEENYQLIATHKQKYEEKIRTYYLYKLK